MQNEITSKTKLLDGSGNIANPGFAKTMLYEYNREAIKANSFRVKEWDFYQVTMGDFILKFTFGNISYVANFTAELFNVVTKESHSFARMKFLPFGSIKLPTDPEGPGEMEAKGKDYKMSIKIEDQRRILKLKGTDKKMGYVDINVELNSNPANEKLVIATPFEKEGRFYLNYKENYYGGKGTVQFGDRTVDVDENSTAVLDWGRGVWPFSQEWFWGNGAAFINGNNFGFNIGWGFGNLESASENMLFMNGTAYKLGELAVDLNVNDYMKPWKFNEKDGRFDMVMTPVHDQVTDIKIGPIQMYCHQLFGYYNGFVILPGGEKLEIKNMLAFCEHAKNKW